MFMSLSALVWSEQGKKISLHTAACFHAQNAPWLQPLFLAAVGIQVADAHIKAEGLARVLGGEPDVSTHPRSGPAASRTIFSTSSRPSSRPQVAVRRP